MHFKQSFDVGHYRCTATVDALEGNRVLAVILFDFAPAAAALGCSPLVIESTAPARHGMPTPRHKGGG